MDVTGITKMLLSLNIRSEGTDFMGNIIMNNANRDKKINDRMGKIGRIINEILKTHTNYKKRADREEIKEEGIRETEYEKEQKKDK
ncbi:hypothetical protein JTB14_007402 [Gonioctena quinquepunctata]|nr:hypothetical protein JTB14_007402 [Gonioctena quinquepunctata]